MGGWRSFAKAIFALPPDEADLAWYRAHCGRREWPGVPFKEAALVVGRRGGKSRFLAFLGVFLATCRDYAPYLAPGEAATVAVIASDRKQARTIFRYVIGLLQAVPMLAEMIVSETADTITLNNSRRNRNRHRFTAQHARLLLCSGFVRRNCILAQRRLREPRHRNPGRHPPWHGDNTPAPS